MKREPASLYVIECRNSTGNLDFTGVQPEHVFGIQAITGIDEDRIASGVWKHHPDAILVGDSISLWPSYVDPRFSARPKTW